MSAPGPRRVRIRVRIHVLGHVQGVFFRQSTLAQAQALGLSGWVENRDDGSVAAEAEGAPDAVERLVAWCRRGPPAARVTRVDVTDLPPGDETQVFTVRR